MNEITNIPADYKYTNIGLIPKDWELKRISEIGMVSSGGTPDTNNADYWNGEIDWCTPTNISALNGNKYLASTKTKITKNGLKNSSAKILPVNSLIACTRATIGKAAINTVSMATNQGFKNISDFKRILVEFLYYRILFDEHRLNRIANGSTFLEVPKNDFDKILIPLPSISEQQKIAAILSAWDRAIENVKLIIDNLRLRNKALAQQLLTGMKRLKGFDEEWGELRADKIFKNHSDKSHNGDLEVLSATQERGVIPRSIV